MLTPTLLFGFHIEQWLPKIQRGGDGGIREKWADKGWPKWSDRCKKIFIG